MPDFWKLSDSSNDILFDVLIKVQVKFILEEAMKAQRGMELYPYSFFNLGAGWGQVVKTTPWLLYPWQRTLVPILCKVGWVPGCLDGCRKSGFPLGFDLQTVQSIASC
jgi:hypothetical protein